MITAYLLIFAACAALISGFLWFARYRRHFLQAATDGVMSPEEVRDLGESNVWSVMFAFSVVASVVMGGFVVAEKMGGDGDKGVLDPWLSYSAMLKVQEGRAGAIETLRFFGDKAKPNTASFETALALLDEPEPRRKKLDDADTRWAKLQSTPARVLENPVTLTAMKSNSGWAVAFVSSDFKMKELFYKLDGSGEFVSTGHQALQNPQTGLPQVNTYLPLPNLAPGEHTIEVKYVDKNDQTNGPYTLKFSTADQQLAPGKMMLNAAIGSWLSFRDFDGKVLLYFTTLMSYRPIIREVRYSLNSDALDQTFTFKPSEKMFEPGDDVYLSVPKNTGFANVQVTFKDGAKSTVQKIMRDKLRRQ